MGPHITKCIFCDQQICFDNTLEHANCEEWYNFIRDIMIDKLKNRLDILLLKKIK
jgi:hypothetical protein